MGISERKQRQMEEVRATILKQSWQIVKDEGWQSLSIRKIADAIEYSTPVVYRHFESKDAILEEFSREGYALLADKLCCAKADHSSPDQQLLAMSYAYWEFAKQHPKHYQIMYGLGIPTCEMVQEIDEIKQVSDILNESIAAAIKLSKNPDVDIHLKRTTFWSILHGLVAISAISAPGCPEKALLTLEDATKGFIKALMN
ncbi:TetR/AcrR family transcriptional regulator [Olivibacter sp. SDN3]|uniref:TetR/AcrR family transcriptional regulator n=1 Tax=Olivibacter sp. SDN3 TaxID=2764720 RepID=UPI00165156D7|nr:TetR/AcrR family transcriptional regulator [Olivibacter sp. SDN3]QNL48035.1 TetR/AcrR family transcriptional regulator [Olivibacter sp. SDN3]